MMESKYYLEVQSEEEKLKFETAARRIQRAWRRARAPSVSGDAAAAPTPEYVAAASSPFSGMGDGFSLDDASPGAARSLREQKVRSMSFSDMPDEFKIRDPNARGLLGPAPIPAAVLPPPAPAAASLLLLCYSTRR